MVFIWLFYSCSAPEVLPSERKLSPAEIEGRSQEHSNNLYIDTDEESKEVRDKEIHQEPNQGLEQQNTKDSQQNTNTEDSDASKFTEQENVQQQLDDDDTTEKVTGEEEHTNTNKPNELDEDVTLSMLKPPFSAWTNQPTSILNPQGNSMFDMERVGVRVEVNKISYGYAQVLCSGCQNRFHNHAGWISLEFLSTYTSFSTQQMKDVLTWRSQISSSTSSKDIQNMDANTMCNIIDAGFIPQDTQLSFLYFQIPNSLSDTKIAITEDILKEDIKGWGCGVKKAKIDD